MSADPELELRLVETDADRRSAMEIRRRVFIEEQSCPPEEEWDGLDGESHHALGLIGGRPVATARWREVRHEGQTSAKLERFAVLPEARGRGLGHDLVSFVMADARRRGHRRLLLHAQAHLQDFYGSLGFQRRGEVFEEAGIPHVEMICVSEVGGRLR